MKKENKRYNEREKPKEAMRTEYEEKEGEEAEEKDNDVTRKE
jgi:hypothetical protein